MSSIIGVYFAASLGAYGDQKELLRRATIEASFSGSLNGSRVIGGGRGRDGTPLAPGSSPGSADMSGGTLLLSSDLTGISWLSALDAYAFARTAVATAKEAFPNDYDPSRHQIPGGFVDNRPFLRALYEFMQCCDALGDVDGAATAGFEILAYDLADRMGARLELPKYLIKQGRYATAAELFERPDFVGTFHRASYLHPLVLPLGRSSFFPKRQRRWPQ